MTRVSMRTGPLRLAAIWGPALLAGLLGSIVTVRTPLWRDEFASLSFAELPVPDLLRAVGHVDAVLLPYYLVAHVTQVVVPSEWALRAPSVLAMALATAAVAGLAARWWGTLAAGAAGLAIALNPLAIQQAATARPYALETFFVAVAALCLDLALTRSRGRRGGWPSLWPWIAYAACLTLAVLMHLFAILLVPAFLLLAVGARRFGRWAAATAAALVVVLPLVLLAFDQREQVAWISRPTWRSGLGALASVVTFRGDSAFGAVEAAALGLVGAVAVAVVLLVARAPVGERAVQTWRAGFALAALGVPWAFLLTISLAWSPFLRTTYLTPSLVGLGLLIGAVAGLGAGWARAHPRRSRWRAAVVLALAGAPLALSAAMVVTVVSRPWYIDDYPGLTRAVTDVVRSDDVLVVVQLANEVGVASGVARNLGDAAYTAELQGQLVTGSQPHFGLRRVVSTGPVRTEALTGPPSGGRVWVVYTRGALTAEEFDSVAAGDLGCLHSELSDQGSFGILRLADGQCTR